MILNHKMFINSLRAKDYAILLGLLLLLHETFRMQLSVYCVDTNTKNIHFLPEILLCFSNIFFPCNSNNKKHFFSIITRWWVDLKYTPRHISFIVFSNNKSFIFCVHSHSNDIFLFESFERNFERSYYWISYSEYW